MFEYQMTYLLFSLVLLFKKNMPIFPLQFFEFLREWAMFLWLPPPPTIFDMSPRNTFFVQFMILNNTVFLYFENAVFQRNTRAERNLVIKTRNGNIDFNGPSAL